MPVFGELGLSERLEALPHVDKYGVEFAFGHEPEANRLFEFREGFDLGADSALNIERAPFDAMLLDAALGAGAEVREGSAVSDIERIDHGDVRLSVGGRPVRSRWILDASGQATLLGKHLGTRRVMPTLRKVAHFAHYRNFRRLEAPYDGFPSIIMMRDGWFWIIPIDGERTSVGLVMAQDDARRSAVAPDRRLAWAIERCPILRERARGASAPDRNGVIADFSYRCRPYAGPGHFLVGDAATFLDPIFSTGVCLGMMAALEAARAIRAVDRDGASPRAAARAYIRYVEGSSSVFFRLVRGYYRHSFRELLMNGTGPLEIHRAVISILGGHVFPKPARSLRWRIALFAAFVEAQRFFPLVPRRTAVGLLDESRSPTAIPPPVAREDDAGAA